MDGHVEIDVGADWHVDTSAIAAVAACVHVAEDVDICFEVDVDEVMMSMHTPLQMLMKYKC